jgi:hypothetical protein
MFGGHKTTVVLENYKTAYVGFGSLFGESGSNSDYRLQNGPSKGAPVKEPTLGSMGIKIISRLINKSIIIIRRKSIKRLLTR